MYGTVYDLHAGMGNVCTMYLHEIGDATVVPVILSFMSLQYPSTGQYLQEKNITHAQEAFV